MASPNLYSACEICREALAPWCRKLNRQIWHCRKCGHIAVIDGLALAPDGRSIYEAEDSIFFSDGNADYYLDETRMMAAESKVRFVRRFWRGNGALLDVGAGFGHFLKAVGSECEAYGVELSPAAVRWSRDKFGVRSQVGSAYDITASAAPPFEAITCWDVIEHLDDPRRALVEMREHLQPRGWIFLSTPDAGAGVAKLMGRHWHYLDPIQHLNLFSQRNLSRLLEEHGFKVEGATHIGSQYRVNYVINRLAFLGGKSLISKGILGAARLIPSSVARRTVKIGLGDVMALAARRVA